MKSGTTVQREIAEMFAILSAAQITPGEFDPVTSFHSDEVNFTDDSWLNYLCRIQYWFRFEFEFAFNEPKGALISRLAQELQVNDFVEQNVHTDQSRIKLSDLYWDELRDRTEKAVELKDAFLEELSEKSLTEATAFWISEWEKYLDVSFESFEPINAKTDTWAITEFTARARNGSLELSPSFQRDSVWPLKDSQKLIESILLGIPLPSIILLEPKSESHSEKPTQKKFEVVDGKQRLTAILRFIGEHPKALKKVKELELTYPGVKFEELYRKDYTKFKTLWKNTVIGEELTSEIEKKYCFPFKLSTRKDCLTGPLQNLRGKYYHEIKELAIGTAEMNGQIKERFEFTGDYKIPIINYFKATPRQIHNVFHLYNRQGKPLNAEEIRNAVYHDVKLLRTISVVAEHQQQDLFDNQFPDLDSYRIVSRGLDDAGIGLVRYRRTKVLSWILSILLSDCKGKGGLPRTLSTAQQIDTLFDRLEKSKNDPLNSPKVISDVFSHLALAFDVHAQAKAWSDEFRGSKTKWQELPLVASLLGVTLSSLVIPDDLQTRLLNAEVKLFNSLEPRPKKTQTETQWRFISKTTIDITQALGVNPQSIKSKSEELFGVSCLESIEKILERDKG